MIEGYCVLDETPTGTEFNRHEWPRKFVAVPRVKSECVTSEKGETRRVSGIVHGERMGHPFIKVVLVGSDVIR